MYAGQLDGSDLVMTFEGFLSFASHDPWKRMLGVGTAKLSNANRTPIPVGNPVAILFGCFQLFSGWFSFNTANTGSTSYENDIVAGYAAINTALCASAGGLGGTAWSFYYNGCLTVQCLANGVLTGLVASCPGVATVEFAPMIFIGATAGSSYCP